jgi:pimeloyl-ACP methyl ester carboxylesterase
MTATLAPPVPPRTRRDLRGRLAGLERPLLAGGLALVALHLLDLAVSGADTTVVGVLAIVALPAAWYAARGRVTRPTRLGLGVTVGLLAFGFGVASHGLHALADPDWRDVTGVGMIAGGLMLVAAGLAALAAPRRAPRRTALGWRAAHGAGWAVGAFLFVHVAFMPLVMGIQITHAPRWPIPESKLAIPHEEVRIAMEDGRELSAWYVASENGANLLLSHGSGGSRGRVIRHIEMLARNGYGVLALDDPGNGESEGHSNGLGNNVQPAIDAALDYLAGRPGVDPARIAGVGTSLGGEVLLEATARDQRLRAVVSDGAMRPQDGDDHTDPRPQDRVAGWLAKQAIRGISGSRLAPSLTPLMPAIAPRPVLLIAGGQAKGEGPTNREYRAAGGPAVELWEIRDAGHTGGLKTHPKEYEARVISFLDRALS